MTPPKAPETRLRSDPFQFEFPLKVGIDSSPLFVPAPSGTSYFSNSFSLGSFSVGGLYFPSNSLTFPKALGPKPTWGPVVANPTPSPKVWKPSDTGQLILDVLTSIDSMDVDLNDLLVNGGKKGCRYSEVVKKDRYDSGKETCKNQFDAGTYSDVHLEIRPVEGKTYSELHRFWALYKKAPGRAGSRIDGFYLTNPLNKDEQGPLSFDRDDAFESGKDFRDAASPSYVTPIGKSVPDSSKSSRLIMRPVGWLYDEGPGISFDISENMLKAWGILDKKIYKDMGIEPYQFPRRLDKLLRLFPIPRPHDPDWVLADSCYDKLPGAEYVRPNSINNLPSLIDWLNPGTLAAELRFRNTSIALGGRGHIDLGSKGMNRIKVTGDSTKLTVEIELGDIPSFQFTQGGYTISAKGLKAGKVLLNLPSLAEINKEFASAPKAYDDLKSDCEKKAELKKKAKEIAEKDNRNLSDVLDELEMQAAADAPKGPAKDHSAFFQKLFGDIRITGIEADELSLERPDRGLKATLKKPVIKTAVINGTDSFTFTGLETDGISVEDTATNIKASTGKSAITEIKVTRAEGGPTFNIKGLSGKDISVNQGDAGIGIDDGSIGNINVDLSTKDRIKVGLTDIASSGKVDYKNPIGGYEFHTSGNSKVSQFDLTYQKDAAGDKVSTALKFSGAVKEFSLKHPQVGELNLTDTEIGESTFDLQVDFPPSGSKEKPVDRYSIDVNVKKATLKSGHVSVAELGESKLTDGHIQLEKAEGPLQGKISGNLDFNIKEITIPLLELGVKGFSIEGTLKDIGIKGAGVLEISPENISLHKLGDTEKPGELKITGMFSHLLFKDDPSVRKEELKKMTNGSTIKTEMDIESAKFDVQDLEGFEFVRPNLDLGRKADLRNFKVKNVSLTGIDASAKIWAKFPIFGWLRGTFPKIGTVTGKLPDDKVNSELRLGSIDISTDSTGKTTQITDLLIQLFEVGGQNQKAKFRLPSLTLSPKLITTGKDPIELEVYFKDSARGGDFDFSLEDEDLSGRSTHPKKK